MLNFLRSLIRPRQRVATIRHRPSLRPALEILEDRCAPAVLTVNSLADTTAAGSVLTLREAIMTVNGNLGRSLTTAEKAQVTGTLGSNDTIQFSLPAGPQTITLTGGTLSITNPVAITGPGASLLTISGNNAVQDFYVGSSFTQNLSLVASISGLTISGGSQQFGAGLFNSATLTLTNTTISNNTATNSGGGLYNNGALTLNNCTLSNNTTIAGSNGSTAGGALFNFGTGTVTITGCTFTGNTAPGTGALAGSGGALSNSGTMTINGSTFNANTCASDGGAIYNDGILTVNNSTLSNNSAGADGGAIRSGLYNGYSTLAMTGCSITGNVSATEGGGIDGTWTAQINLTNCTFTNNTTGSIGGAVRFDSSMLFLTNDTITANRVLSSSATLGGGGIYIEQPATLQNTIIAGNFSGDAPSTTANDIFGSTVDPSSSFNLIGTGGAGGLTNGVNGNRVGVSSLCLGPLANNGGPTQTVALLVGSPAIDHGSNTFVTAGETDQRGMTRIVNGTVDIGAFEVQPTTLTSAAPSNQVGAQGVQGTFSLGSFSDSNGTAGPWSVDVNWGDNTSDSTFTTSTQGTLGTLTHLYRPSGAFTVAVTVTNANHNTSQAAFQIAVAAAQEVITVNSLADNTTADNVLTLREAIQFVDGTLGRALTAGEQAQIAGTVGNNPLIQFNLPAGPQTIKLTGGAVSITKAAVISGPGANLLNVNGNNAGRVFIVGVDYSQNLSLNVSISGLTISGGSAVAGSTNYGGGLLNFGTLAVSNCTFSGNAAGSSGGGGIYDDGAMTVTNSIFSSNSVSNGSGASILVATSGTLGVTSSTFSGNTGLNGGQGGGISNSGTANVANCTFTNNTVGSNGGGIHNSPTGKLTLTNSTFTGGVCASDGGGFDSDGTATVTYCTFANNSVGSEGGAIDNHGTLTISNSTLVNNTSVSRGGAINSSGASQITNCTITGNRVSSTSGAGGAIDDTTAAKIYNSIVIGNFRGPSSGITANDIIGNVASASSYNLIGTGGAGSLVNGVNGNQVGVANALLGALASNGGPTQTVALLPGSPAIDRGGNANVAAGATDQRGLTRIVNGTVDIGAFEVQGLSASTFTVTAFPSSVQAGVAGTIAVTAKNATGGVATNYTGTVHFTSSDPQAVLPADYTFVTSDNGVHSFSVTLKTVGSQSITAKDNGLTSITGTQSGITVAPAAASTFAVAGFPNPTTAGVAGLFTVTARDAFGNTAAGYTGTVHFTSSDSRAVLPANYTFVAADNGVHSFSATLKTAGSQAVTATDTTTGITGVHAAIAVNPASASTLALAGFPSPTLAGAAGTFTVTVTDTFGNVAASYLGTVHFTSSDGSALLPADYTFVSGDNGVHTFSATFKTTGTQTLSATDKIAPTITGTHAGITVNPAVFSALSVIGFPSPTTAGVAGTFTVTALDTLGNIVTSYRGTLRFTSADGQAVLPANYTFVAADNGVHSFSATLKTAGSQAITATDTITGITGVHAAIAVNPASASTLALAGFPSPTLTGAIGTFTVTAKDPFGNNTASYLGTVHFTSGDAQAVLPADYTFVASDSGVHTFSATFKTAGTQVLTATDKANASITGTHAGITVNLAAFATLRVTGFPSPTAAGVAGSFTVTALDTLGNLATSYVGTLHFTSSDSKVVLPADYTFVPGDGGVHTFSATLKTAGSQSITATDASAGVIGLHSAITVTPASASNFTLSGFPSPTQVGVSSAFTVRANDAFGNIATGYLGTVHFTSSDAQAVLPADYTYVAGDNGVHTFSATFQTVGTQTLTATDKMTVTITGTHAAITVNSAVPTLTVNSTADNTTADNYLTLRVAIAVVDGTLGRALTAGEQAQISGTLGANDAIQFNLPAGPQTITLTGGALDITQSVAINGPGTANLTINGNNADRVFIVGYDYSQNLSLNVAIGGLTVTGGSAVVSGKNYGGGLLNFGTLALNNVAFTGNTAGSSGGGAIYNDGAITISNSIFTANSVTSGGPGGGIQNSSSGTANVTNCTFTSNTASGGASGACIANSGHLTVTGCTMTGNTADSNAGGIYNSSEGTLIVSTTTIANNAGGSDGGGIDNDGAATITSSTISGNSTGSEGGGLGNKGSVTLTNVTLYGNTAASEGGGMQSSGTATLTNCTVTANRVAAGSSGFFGGGVYATTAVSIFNTIVAGNFRGAAPSSSADDIAGAIAASSAFNLIGAGGSGGLVNGVNNNQVGVINLGLGALADNGGPTLTIALLAGSPAIDQGSNVFVIAGETDQRGFARIVNGTVDIGAFELQLT